MKQRFGKRILSPLQGVSGPKMLIIITVLVTVGVGVVLVTRAAVPVYNTNWAFWGPRIKGCESGSGPLSGGNYTAQNKTSTASGAYQFLDSTWAGFGGYEKARLAPPEIQEQKAYATFTARGTQPWVSSYFCWQAGEATVAAETTKNLPSILKDYQQPPTDLSPLIPGAQDIATDAKSIKVVTTAPADGLDPYLGSPIVQFLRLLGFLRA
jgi:hypothetical protein